jgi:ketopantoate reductase
MNILVCSVGVIGTLCAARLRDNGHQVTPYSREANGSPIFVATVSRSRML